MRSFVTTHHPVFKFQDLIYFAAEEHSLIDAVRARGRQQAGCFPDQRKQPINAIAFHLFSSVLAISEHNSRCATQMQANICHAN